MIYFLNAFFASQWGSIMLCRHYSEDIFCVLQWINDNVFSNVNVQCSNDTVKKHMFINALKRIHIFALKFATVS